MEFKNTDSFIQENFLLQNKTAERLFFENAISMPIIDYHNHLPPDVIAANQPFEGINEIWLDGDHYKWRAMRSLGIPEKFIKILRQNKIWTLKTQKTFFEKSKN